MPDDYLRPAYDLAEIQRLVKSGGRSYRIEPIATRGAGKLRFDEQDIVECVLGLDPRCRVDGGNFYKSMESKRRPGLFQDVYKTRYCGKFIYCKLQLVHMKTTISVIIQFKKDETP